MLLFEHIKIIETIFTSYLKWDEFFSSVNNDVHSSKFTKDMLLLGLQYPDLPCGKFKLTEQQTFELENYKLCNPLKLLQLSNQTNKAHSTIYQFHEGYFAHLHAMTTHPYNTVQKIRDKIVLSLCGFGLLALCGDTALHTNPEVRPNAFWAGIILHTITDSYSVAHTIRNPDSKYWTVENMDNNNIQLHVHKQLKELAENTDFKVQNEQELYDEIIPNFYDNPSAVSYIETHIADIWSSFALFRFEFTVNKTIKLLEFKVPADCFEKLKNLSHNEGDIVNFQYHLGQGTVFHTKYDLLHHVKKNNTYERMMSECVEFLTMYRNAIINQDVNGFIQNLFCFLLTKTFHISMENLKNPTNRVYDDSPNTKA